MAAKLGGAVVTAGLFAEWQPRYADRGIATFPVRNKRPAVKGYLQAGLRASREFAGKFPSEGAFGLACKKNRIVVLDVDSPDERLLADALSEFGPTPFVVRSGSGNFQAWYRHNGERRQVRPDHRPIDILGGGFVVAPPSIGANGSYTILTGSLDDLSSLPEMITRPAAAAPVTPVGVAPIAGLTEVGRRNDTLWRVCMTRVRKCSDISELMGVAEHHNSLAFYEPLPDAEVRKIVASAWEKERVGDNWFGRGRMVALSTYEIDGLLGSDPDACVLLIVLRRHHWGRDFVVANGMAPHMPGGGWTRKRFASARQRLIDEGAIEQVWPASRLRGPAVYRFKGEQN